MFYGPRLTSPKISPNQYIKKYLHLTKKLTNKPTAIEDHTDTDLPPDTNGSAPH